MRSWTRDQLRGIVAIWLTNGQKPVDACNDTRYDYFAGGYNDAHEATRSLVEDGFLECDVDRFEWEGEVEVTLNYSKVWPTARGVFEAIS